MWFLKIVGALLLQVAMCALAALVSFAFLRLAWNGGIVPALGFAHEISMGQAYLLDFGALLLACCAKGASIQMRE